MKFMFFRLFLFLILLDPLVLELLQRQLTLRLGLPCELRPRLRRRIESPPPLQPPILALVSGVLLD